MPARPHDTTADHALEHLDSVSRNFTPTDDLTLRRATLGSLLSLIAHELNNALAPAHAYTQLALASPRDARLARKALASAADGIDRSIHIAQAILAFTQSTTDPATPPTTQHANISRALDRALACLARPLARDRIRLEAAIPHNAAAAIQPIALEHILLNLILNARRAMLPAGGVLTARVSDHTLPPDPPPQASVCFGSVWNVPPHRWCLIEIGDTGPGFPPDTLSALAAARHPGLGLALCHRFISAASGRLWITSSPTGSICTILLTAAAAEPIHNTNQTPNQSPPPPSVPDAARAA